MHERVDTGTDAAMIGAWDASRSDSVLSTRWGRVYDNTLDGDAAQGHLFLIHTGADCGGPVDVYLDEDVPEQVRKGARPVDGEFLLSVPTGRMVVGGVEDYRSAKPRITAENSIVPVPSGDYRLRCYVGQADENSGPSPSEIEARAISAEDHAYYHSFQRRDNWRAIYILLPMLLLPALWPWLGWKIALAIAIGVLIAWANLLDRHWKRQPVDERWKRINKTLQDASLAGQSPLFILELHRVGDRGGLQGGSVRL
jgi:hypothetical protein